MARSIKTIQLDKPDDFVLSVMNNYLQKNGFSLSEIKNESVYRAGRCFFDGYRYLKWSYADGVLKLEVWINSSLGLESSLEGFLSYDRKTLYKQSLEDLSDTLHQTAPIRNTSNEKMAVFSLLLGILALIIMNPVLCIFFASLSATLAPIGLHSDKAGLARIGRLCAIVSLLTTSMIYLLRFYIQVI